MLISNKIQAVWRTVGRQPGDKYLLTNGASLTGESSVVPHEVIIIKEIDYVTQEEALYC